MFRNNNAVVVVDSGELGGRYYPPEKRQRAEAALTAAFEDEGWFKKQFPGSNVEIDNFMRLLPEDRLAIRGLFEAGLNRDQIVELNELSTADNSDQ